MCTTEAGGAGPFEAVLFDLDGTLLDTLADLANAGNQVLDKLGMPVYAVDSYKDFVGDGARTLIQRILPADRRDGETVHACLAEFRLIYARGWKIKTRPHEGVMRLLAELTHRGLPMGVLSNKPQETFCLRGNVTRAHHNDKTVTTRHDAMRPSWRVQVSRGFRVAARRPPLLRSRWERPARENRGPTILGVVPRRVPGVVVFRGRGARR